MSRTGILLVDFRKMKRLPDESSIVLRLMMAANDILVADAALKHFSSLESERSLRLGRGRYFVNLQCGHLAEAVNKIVPALETNALLKAHVGCCARRVQEAHELLVELAPGGGRHTEFEAEMQVIRDKLTFHYYNWEKEKQLLTDALESCAGNPERRLSKIAYSDTGSRFVAADVINDEIVTRMLWKIPSNEDVEEASDKKLDEMSRWTRTFMEFAEGFVWEYIRRHCAAT